MFDETAAAATTASAAATCDPHIDHHLRHEKKVKCLQQVKEKTEQKEEGDMLRLLPLLLAMGSGQTMRHRRSQKLWNSDFLAASLLSLMMMNVFAFVFFFV